MELVAGESVRVGEVGVRLEGGVRSASVTRGSRSMSLRGTRSGDAVTDLLESSGFRVSAAVDLELQPLAPGLARSGGPTGKPQVVLEAPPLGDDEAQVALVEEDGELRWVFPGRDDPRHFVIDVDDEVSANRGVVGSLIRKGVKFLTVKAAKPIAGKAVESLAALAEGKLRPHRIRPFGPDTYTSMSKDLRSVDFGDLTSAPSLLFIHGTNSSTAGGFGKLPNDWVRDLNRRYGGRVFAFDHPTLSVLPSVNADEFGEMVRKELPAGKTLELDVIAHSRGGLVARELAERPRDGVNVRSVTFVATPNNGTPLASAEHLGSFVDVMTNLAAVIPDNPVTDALQVIFELVKDIALDIAFDSLPGIKAMTPDGDYLTALNDGDRPDGLVYRAVAANFEPLTTASPLAKLRNRVFDGVFQGAMNDLVVPTRSAYLHSGGFQVRPHERIVLDSTRSVSHSTFWTENDVLARLDEWFDSFVGSTDWPPPAPAGDPKKADPRADIEANMETGDGRGITEAIEAVADLPAKFQEAIEQATGGPVRRPSSPSSAQGDVILLPGIMGSLIATEDGPVWVDPWKLARGAFTTLSLDRPTHTGRATGLNMAYATITARLAEHWRVHLFPFDWRKSLVDSAKLLNEFVRSNVFDGGKRPVHIVAHSMGGLLARTFIQHHARTWNEMADGAGKNAAGGRLVMLGTPNLGSYAIPLALTGQDMLVKGLAAVDLSNSKDDIKRVVATFPGMYQMLPAPSLDADGDDHLKLFDATSWADAPIDPQLLQDAREFQDGLADAHKRADTSRMVYVAGDKRKTPGRIRIDRGEHHFGVTDEGDGRVLHSAGELPGVPMYYSLASHGGLVTDETVLGALDELLTTGATEQLSTARYPRRSADTAEAIGATVPADAVDPDPPSAANRGVGGGPTRSDAAAVMAESMSAYVDQPSVGPVGGGGLRVRVTHASLEQAKHPVVVGHYRGIPIEGAEGFLNWRLDRALSRRFEIDDYPQDPGEVIFVVGPTPRPRAGIVIGLGDFGDLTRAKLVKSIRTAAVRRALAANEAGESGSVGLSTVLVGSPGDYDLTIGVAMSAIVEGVARASIDLAEMGGASVTLDDLEIVELYEIRAIRAARQLRTVVGSLPHDVLSAVQINPDDTLGVGRGGRPGLPMWENSGAWPRFMIERRLPPCPPPQTNDDCEHPYPCGDAIEVKRETMPSLEFTQLGNGAQIDRLSVAFDDEKVESLIAAAVGKPTAVDESFALFEMLFPHQQKLELDDADNLHLLVDEDSAYIPWELLYGRGDGRYGQALALRTGMLRQLRPGRGGEPTRRTGRRPEGLRALVVGDPPAGDDYVRLPGARTEARLVRDLLERNGYEVDALIYDEDADPETAWIEIQAALYKHPYKIIHFATHGEVDDERPERSGLLIGHRPPEDGDEDGTGSDVRLTALDIKQMSATPDLVFVNACHTGRTGTGLGAARSSARVDQIASNFALQLMRNGVRAVIAAGWAVDDAAALAFASKTYESLLNDVHYGEAVRRGREDAFDGGRSNTWGAYQCYGDPSFSLRGRSSGSDDDPSVSPRDVIERLDTLKQQASDQVSAGGLRWVYDRVVAVDASDVPRFATAEVYEALGRAYGELGSHADAVWAYRQASVADAGAGAVTLTSREQLSNMEVRLAAEVDRNKTSTLPTKHEVTDSASQLFRSAERRLKDLDRLESTHERQALLASAYKKRGAGQSRAEGRNKQAGLSRDAYAAALGESVSRTGKLDAYSACNWIQMSRVVTRTGELPIQQAVLRLLEYGASKAPRELGDHPTLLSLLPKVLGPKVLASDVKAFVAAVAEHIGETEIGVAEKARNAAPAIDFWADAAPGDLALTRLIFDGGAGDPAVAESYYLAAFKNRSAARERASVLDHLDDLLGLMTSRHPAHDNVAQLVDSLREEVRLIEAGV